MIITRALVLMFAACLSLNAWHKVCTKRAWSPAAAAWGICGRRSREVVLRRVRTGPDAVVLIHDGIAHSAVWDDVWPAFCNGSIPFATTAADMAYSRFNHVVYGTQEPGNAPSQSESESRHSRGQFSRRRTFDRFHVAIPGNVRQLVLVRAVVTAWALYRPFPESRCQQFPAVREK